MITDNKLFTLVFPLFLTAALSGCATSSKMQVVPPEKVISEAAEGKAMIVFMRPSSFGANIQSSVFEIKDGNPELVGIVSTNTKVSYQLDSGNYLFMVIGENADFMSADLVANKTYYARVTPKMGWWEDRFSLRPVQSTELDTAEFNEWLKACEWVKNTTESEAWAKENMDDILSKQKDHYTAWKQTDLIDRIKLLAEDGRPVADR